MCDLLVFQAQNSASHPPLPNQCHATDPGEERQTFPETETDLSAENLDLPIQSASNDSPTARLSAPTIDKSADRTAPAPSRQEAHTDQVINRTDIDIETSPIGQQSTKGILDDENLGAAINDIGQHSSAEGCCRNSDGKSSNEIETGRESDASSQLTHECQTTDPPMSVGDDRNPRTVTLTFSSSGDESEAESSGLQRTILSKATFIERENVVLSDHKTVKDAPDVAPGGNKEKTESGDEAVVDCDPSAKPAPKKIFRIRQANLTSNSASRVTLTLKPINYESITVLGPSRRDREVCLPWRMPSVRPEPTVTWDDPHMSPSDLAQTEVIGSDLIEAVDSDSSSESEVTVTIHDVHEVEGKRSVLNDIEPIEGKYLDSSCQSSAVDDVNHLTKLAYLAEGSSSSSSGKSEEKNVNYSRGTNDWGKESRNDSTRSDRCSQLVGIQSKRDSEPERCPENEAPTRIESPTSSNLEQQAENSIQMSSSVASTELSLCSPRVTDGIHDPSSLGSQSGELASRVSFTMS